MPDIRFDTEKELIAELMQSKAYTEFKQKHLQPKIDREKRAWMLLEEHKGHHTRDTLNKIFDTVDLDDNNKRWFGMLLATPNRNLILATEPETINQWLGNLLFAGAGPEAALDSCLKRMKIKGASKGLATLLLYLSDPHKFSIWVNATQEGLNVLSRIGEFKGNDWGKNYTQFNKAAIDFRTQYSFQPQEVDWVLTYIGTYLDAEDNHFLISEDALDTKDVALTVDDESDLDDVVGQPMELQVMRWTPTNEMGVVALFIEFRRELGFPLVEVIRTRFPDAAVFEDASKGYVRRYIEFEFKSSGFKAHLKSKRQCHYVICWEHDWKDCPIPVIELRLLIPAILSKKQRGG